MTFSEFLTKYNGKGIDDDGYYGYQCMDLAHRYAKEVVGKDFAPAPAAKDVWNQTIDGYDKIPNTPDGVPSKGDIIIWGVGIGPYGHIAIFDHGDVSFFTSFDQNWPLNSLCHYQNHNYTGVLGWFHPQNIPVQNGDPSFNENNIKKAIQFDRITSFLHSISILPTDKSEDYMDSDKLLEGVENLSNENKRKQLNIEELTVALATCCNQAQIPLVGDSSTLQTIKNIVHGKGWPWNKINRIKQLIPK